MFFKKQCHHHIIQYFQIKFLRQSFNRPIYFLHFSCFFHLSNRVYFTGLFKHLNQNYFNCSTIFKCFQIQFPLFMNPILRDDYHQKNLFINSKNYNLLFVIILQADRALRYQDYLLLNPFNFIKFTFNFSLHTKLYMM